MHVVLMSCVDEHELMFLFPAVIRLLQKYERLEYRGDWAAQYLKADIVGCPGQGVPIALYEAEKRY